MNKIYIILMATVLTFSMFGLVAADPNGAYNLTEESTSTTTDLGTAANHSAIAGNVTEITITGESVSQTWQGYFGNVSGTIQLGNADGDIMYNWSLASPQGEVLASTASSITWSGIDCFNYSANGETLELAFGVDSTAADGVNETFTDSSHAAFSIGTKTFTANNCSSSLNVFDTTGASASGVFEEVLLRSGSDTIYASLLEEDAAGFDDKSHDFQMLVLEDGHDGDSDTTTYFFYVELE